MSHGSVISGFLPWIVFWVVSGPSTWKWAALAALIAAVVLTGPEVRRTGRIGLLDVVTVVFFAVLAVLALVLDRGALQWLEDRAQLLSSAVLAVATLGSVLAGRPFTIYYAEQTVDPKYWSSPLFRRTNTVISLVWGAVFAVCALLDLFTLGRAGTDDLLNWALPAVLIVAAVKFSAWYPQHLRQAQPAGASPPGDPRAS